MKVALKVLCCLAVVVLVVNVQADDRTLTPVQYDGVPAPIGDPAPPGTLIYDNTVDSGFYGPPPLGAFPVVVADDVHYTGTPHINTFVFGYATDDVNDQEIIVNFYGALDPTDSGPDLSSSLLTLDLTGLPGTPDPTVHQGYEVTVDLAGAGADFDWPINTTPGGIMLNWVGFTFQVGGTDGSGPILASGGGSLDLFFADKDLRPPFAPMRGFWWYGGPPNPEASYHIQLIGTP